MPDSSAIDQAILATLGGDAALLAICSDGAYWQEAPPNSKRFVIVSLVDERDEAQFGGRAYEDALYLIKAVVLSTTGADIKAAAARIDVLLEDQPVGVGAPPVVAGYSWMACFREARVRQTEVDAIDPSIRWFHRGGMYRIQMAVNA